MDSTCFYTLKYFLWEVVPDLLRFYLQSWDENDPTDSYLSSDTGPPFQRRHPPVRRKPQVADVVVRGGRWLRDAGVGVGLGEGREVVVL